MAADVRTNRFNDRFSERQRTVMRRVFILLVVAACAVALKIALDRTVTGEPEVARTGGREQIVELLRPPNGSEVLRQSEIMIDLTSDFDATLVVNGKQIPDSELLRRPELNQVSFTPGPGKTIEQLPGGRTCVEAIVWRVTNPDLPLQTPIRWCFKAT